MMKSKFFIFIITVTLCTSSFSQNSTHRTNHFENAAVKVWETIIQPGKSQILKMHRHDHDRVLVALTDGTLKIVNDQGMTKFFKLKANESYYLKKDPVNEYHIDENVGDKNIKVIIIELKNT